VKVKTVRYNSWYRPSLTSPQKFSVVKEGKRVEVYKWSVKRRVHAAMFGYVVHVASIADCTMVV